MSPFLRRVKTSSGATAVQIMEKDGQRNRVVKHLGSAHTPAQLKLLMEAGRRELAPGQDMLDFGEDDDAGAEGFTPVVGASRSRILWRVLSKAYDDLGFDQLVDDAFRQLVLARIIEPASKADTVRILQRLGIQAVHENTFYNSLRRVAQRDYRAKLASACFDHAASSSDVSLILYDVTTLYFEAENEDEVSGPNGGLRRVGYSKERRVDPQITVGLLVDRAGFPLEVHCFEGNRAETTTILSVIEAFQKRNRVSDFWWLPTPECSTPPTWPPWTRLGCVSLLGQDKPVPHTI